jgi:hypothetical protein
MRVAEKGKSASEPVSIGWLQTAPKCLDAGKSRVGVECFGHQSRAEVGGSAEPASREQREGAISDLLAAFAKEEVNDDSATL